MALPTTNVLAMIDAVRRGGGNASDDGRVVRAETPGSTVITYVAPGGDTAALVEAEVARASARGAGIEWEVYGHDAPHDLTAHLGEAGFVAEPKEQVLWTACTHEALERFVLPRASVRRVGDGATLEDVAEVSRGVGRQDVETRTAQFTRTLSETPSAMSIYVAFVDGRPVASGRIHYPSERLPIAWLAGGQTKPEYRRQGHYLGLVRSRIGEGIGRGCAAIVVDALPSSEPLLRARGFAAISSKQAFMWSIRA